MANPGRGWIVVDAVKLTAKSILDSLIAGEFYFSTGIDLKEMHIGDDSIELSISQHRDYIYNTKFIGIDGVVLQEVLGLQPKYQIRGDETYVRAKVTSSMGTRMWTQPAYINN